MNTDFLGTVMTLFGYLIAEYGFHVGKTDISSRSPKTEGRIDFESPTTFVIVSSEQWAARTIVGRIQDDRYRNFLDPLQIRKYYVLTGSEKKLMLSLDPQDDEKAKMLHQAANLTRVKGQNESTDDYIIAQLSDYSKWLREYAEAFLRGDFTQWRAIYEFNVFSSRAAYIRSGKKEFIRRIPQDKDKRLSIFQDEFDYLEGLASDRGNQ